MTNILDRVARGRREFRPETTQEFFALQLARRLDDVGNVKGYVELVDRFSEDYLLRVYRATLDKGRGEGMADRFQVELRHRTREGDL